MQQGAWKRTNICRWCCIQIIPSAIKILEWNERSGSSQLVDDFWRIQGTDNVCHVANYSHCVSRKEKLIQDLDLLLLSLLCAHVTSIIHCNHNRSHFPAEARQLSNNKCKSITFVKIFIHIQWSRTGRNYIRHVSDFVIVFYSLRMLVEGAGLYFVALKQNWAQFSYCILCTAWISHMRTWNWK